MELLEKRYILKSKFILPKNAKIIFESKLFRIYQYPQKLLNNKIINFECVKRQDNAQVILIYENKIILTKEIQPHFNKPLIGLSGGNVEWNETSKNGVIREAFEETGIKINKLILFATDNFNQQKMIRDFYLYIGWGEGKLKPQNSPSEKIEILELSFEEFIKETQKKDFRNPTLKKIIKDIIKNKKLNEFKNILKIV